MYIFPKQEALFRYRLVVVGELALDLLLWVKGSVFLSQCRRLYSNKLVHKPCKMSVQEDETYVSAAKPLWPDFTNHRQVSTWHLSSHKASWCLKQTSKMVWIFSTFVLVTGVLLLQLSVLTVTLGGQSSTTVSWEMQMWAKTLPRVTKQAQFLDDNRVWTQPKLGVRSVPVVIVSREGAILNAEQVQAGTRPAWVAWQSPLGGGWTLGRVCWNRGF